MPANLVDTDPVGRLFAKLTGQLEAAAGTATEGQNQRRSTASRLLLASRLRTHLGRAATIVTTIERAIGDRNNGRGQ